MNKPTENEWRSQVIKERMIDDAAMRKDAIDKLYMLLAERKASRRRRAFLFCLLCGVVVAWFVTLVMLGIGLAK